MAKYENYVNWRLPADLRQAIRVAAAKQNKKQQNLAIEILSRVLLENFDAKVQLASSDSTMGRLGDGAKNYDDLQK